MSLFDGILPFVHTAEARSFRKAAEELGVTPAAVSKAVGRLEEELGVRLLHRTTRRVSLSEEGELFLARAREAIASVRAGRDQVTLSQRAPKGDLVVSAPFILGRFLVTRLPTFTGRFPALRVLLRFTDRRSRLVDERVDVALRVGELDDSTLVGHRLMTPRWCTVASPAYLARRSTPEHPDELPRFDCLRFRSPRGKAVDWTFLDHPGGIPRTIAVDGPAQLDQGELLVDAAVAGLGLAQAFDFMVDDRILEGKLVEILGAYAAGGPSIHAVFLPEQRGNPKVRAFVDFLAEITRVIRTSQPTAATRESPRFIGRRRVVRENLI